MPFGGDTELGSIGKAAVAVIGRVCVLDGIMDEYEAQNCKRLAGDHRPE